MISKKTWALGFLAFLSFGHSSWAQRAEGFGKDVPFSFAVRQIVPNDYLVRFETSVDQAAIVSWSGSDDWQVVLGRLASSRGTSFRVDGQTVVVGGAANRSAPSVLPGGSAAVVRPNATAARPVEAQMTQRSPAGAAVVPPVPSAEVRTGGLVIRPARAQPSGTEIAAQPVPSPREANSSGGGASSNGRAVPAPVASETLPPLAQAGAATGAVSAPVGSDPAAWQRTPTPPNAGATPTQTREVSRERPSPPASAQTEVRPAPSPRSPNVRVAAEERSSPGRAMAVGAWRAPRGETLNNVLSDWADKSGWSVVFRSRVVYELQAGAQFEGDFVEAATALLKSVQADPAPSATFYRGNRVLVVSDGTN